MKLCDAGLEHEDRLRFTGLGLEGADAKRARGAADDASGSGRDEKLADLKERSTVIDLQLAVHQNQQFVPNTRNRLHLFCVGLETHGARIATEALNALQVAGLQKLNSSMVDHKKEPRCMAFAKAVFGCADEIEASKRAADLCISTMLLMADACFVSRCGMVNG